MASMAKRFCPKTCNICVGTGKGQGGMAKTCKGDRSKKCQTSSKVTAHSCARLGEENVHNEAATGPGDGGGGGVGDSVPVPFDSAAALIVMHRPSANTAAGHAHTKAHRPRFGFGAPRYTCTATVQLQARRRVMFFADLIPRRKSPDPRLVL